MKKVSLQIGKWIGLDDGGFIFTDYNMNEEIFLGFRTKRELLWDIQVRSGCSRKKPRTKKISQGLYNYTVKGEDGWRPQINLIQLTEENIEDFKKIIDKQIKE